MAGEIFKMKSFPKKVYVKNLYSILQTFVRYCMKKEKLLYLHGFTKEERYKVFIIINIIN